jgi:hypothetical protein
MPETEPPWLSFGFLTPNPLHRFMFVNAQFPCHHHIPPTSSITPEDQREGVRAYAQWSNSNSDGVAAPKAATATAAPAAGAAAAMAAAVTVVAAMPSPPALFSLSHFCNFCIYI